MPGPGRHVRFTPESRIGAGARELVTDLFKRQAADKSVARGEALRQAMMAMLEGPDYTDASGKTVFAYAHPPFWAPYTRIGDGGRR